MYIEEKCLIFSAFQSVLVSFSQMASTLIIKEYIDSFISSELEANDFIPPREREQEVQYSKSVFWRLVKV